MQARQELLKMIDRIRKTADDYILLAVELHEYADLVEGAACKYEDAECETLIAKLKEAAPEMFSEEPDRGAN